MQKESMWCKPSLIAAACALALVATLCALAYPAKAMAADTGIAHSIDESGIRTNYKTVDEAKSAGYGGAVIVMDDDWDFGTGSLDLADSKSITIDMNGHRFRSSNKTATIYLNEHASLKLTSSAKAISFQYTGYKEEKRQWQTCWVTAAGFVGNTDDDAYYVKGVGSGIWLENNASLVIENVAVAGCGSSGIVAKDNCSIDMTNTTVCRNRSGDGKGDGGGMKLGTGSKLTMNASHINQNNGWYKGGGIYAEKSVNIFMENGSEVNGNVAGEGGGGVYFNGTFFTLKSKDGTGTIANNESHSSTAVTYDDAGGGIHVDAANGQNESLIEGLAIRGNSANKGGGGIELNQRWTTVRNCTITGNYSKEDGGGIFVGNSNNTIDGCTITGNWCCADSEYSTNTGNYEGGGIFVGYKYDINMRGKCIIKDNTRNKKDSGNADDVFLSTLSGGGGKAYITGSLSYGSTVGVRTGITDDRRIAKNFKPETKDCLFCDMDGYYVSYGSDEGGDAWQRHTTKEFTARVNGQDMGRYRNGTSVTLSAPAAAEGKTFWFWSDHDSEGLYPLSDYLSDANRYSSSLTFKMPQNDVGLSAIYADIVGSAEIHGFKAPAAGEELPATAYLTRTDGKRNGANNDVPASITWYEVSTDGNTKTAVTGKAKAGTTYVASFTVQQNIKFGCFFDEDLGAESLTVKADSGAAANAINAEVDPNTGALTAESAAFTIEGTAPESEAGTITLKLEKEGALGGGSTAAVSLAEGSGVADGGLIDEVEISYDKSSENVSIAAPYVENYNFCNWSGTLSGWTVDDVAGVVTLPVSDLEIVGSTLTAVYTPVVTEATVEGLNAPKAGDDLSSTVKDIVATCSDGTTMSFAEALGVKGEGFKVTWSPAGEESIAGFSTAYTAVIELADGDDLVDVEKVLAQDAVVTCKGTETVKATSAGFTIKDGKLCLAVTFGETRDVKANSVSQPADVELSFEEAKDCAEAGSWPLPSSVDVALEGDEVADGDITWNAVEGFDENATTAQQITVKGTVSNVVTADGNKVDTSGVSLDVSTTVKIAAPSQGGGEDGGETPAANPDDGNGEPAADADGKSALAKTGDSIPVFAVAAVVVIAVAAVAVAIVAARRRRQ